MSGRPVLGRMRRGVLRMLAAAGTAGQASKDMAPLATRTVSLRQQQCEVNEVLAVLRDFGLVVRGEREAAVGGPYRWYITAEGAAAAARPSDREAAAASKARNEARRQAADEALACARAVGCGPGTPRGERRAISATLRAAGCTFQQIGDLFGVTRQTICKSLAEAGER